MHPKNKLPGAYASAGDLAAGERHCQGIGRCQAGLTLKGNVRQVSLLREGERGPGLCTHAGPGLCTHAGPGLFTYVGPGLCTHAGPGLCTYVGPGLCTHAGPGLCTHAGLSRMCCTQASAHLLARATILAIDGQHADLCVADLVCPAVLLVHALLAQVRACVHACMQARIFCAQIQHAQSQHKCACACMHALAVVPANCCD